MIRHIAIVALIITSASCRTVVTDLDGDTGTESPLAIATAAMYRQWGLEKSLAQAQLAAGPDGCIVIQTARQQVEANRERIDAYIAAMESGSAVASADWSRILGVVLTGIEVTSTIQIAEDRAKEALDPSTSPQRLQSLSTSATLNYDASKVMWDGAIRRCGL